jgi:hypothetical protein
MPESFLRLARNEQLDALEVAAAAVGMPTHLLEKDVWVVWALDVFFESSLGSALTFKGGTSLSKAYGVIDRFSEDVDLTVDIRTLVPQVGTSPSPLPPSSSQAKKWTSDAREGLRKWVGDEAVPLVAAALERDGLEAALVISGEHRDKILVQYAPLAAGTGYAAPQVILEFGARSTGQPRETRRVVCSMAEALPGLAFPQATVHAMKVARTFWEKATAAHVYCLQGKAKGERYSRHWHDLVAIMDSTFFADVHDRKVAADVAEHKSFFFVEKDCAGEVIDYRAAVRGKLRIVPEGEALASLRLDYERMIEDGILLRARVGFDALMHQCRELEILLNG